MGDHRRTVGRPVQPKPRCRLSDADLLEELGYVRAESSGGTKRLYSATEEGANYLAANRALVDAVFSRMAEVKSAIGPGPAPEIRRALGNLEMALSIRLGKSPLGPEQIQAITQALDRTASEIERV